MRLGNIAYITGTYLWAHVDCEYIIIESQIQNLAMKNFSQRLILYFVITRHRISLRNYYFVCLLSSPAKVPIL